MVFTIVSFIKIFVSPGGKDTPLCFIILRLSFRCVVHVLICIWCEMGVRVHFNPTGYPVVLTVCDKTSLCLWHCFDTLANN